VTQRSQQPDTELRLRLAQGAARLGYWDYDPSTSEVAWDEACAAIFGTALADFEGTLAGFEARCHPDDVARVHDAIAATGGGKLMEVSFRAVLPNGSVRHVLSRGQGLSDDAGNLQRLVGVILDVTAMRSADLRQQRAANRLASLATVALAMSQAQSDEDLTRLVIEHGAMVLGADGGAVCVRDDARGIIRLAMTESLGEDVQLEYGELPLDGPLPGSWTARTGEAVYLPDRAAGLAFSSDMQIVYDGTDRDAWAVLPLRGADRLLGSLVISWAEPRQFPSDERDLLGAFAAQTAQALDRIQSLQAERRLAREARRLTETLQRSLLTPPPQPEGIQIAVRYAAAAEQAAVGGDWYDGFITPDGALSLVIGDCVGHDRQAAASMATMRNLLRATAYAIGEPPAAVLAALERALRGLDVDVLATALLARLQQTPEQVARAAYGMTWSNAGHLPPVLRTPDGSTTLLRSEPDLLLGLNVTAERTDSWVELEEGSTVLLFTDGLVERRDEDLDDGLERLRTLLSELGHLPLEELCDAVLEGMARGESEDDVALLALRTSPGGDDVVPMRARPAMAGLVAERTIGLPAEPRSARDARAFVTEVLRHADRERWADSACLAVSEVVTNAVLHAHTDLTVTARVETGGLRVEVRDHNAMLPSPRHYDSQATTGRGMDLVAAVTRSHGITPLATGGKVVWFVVADDDDVTVSEEDPARGWEDEAPVVPRSRPGDVETVLQGMPTTLWLAAQQHHDALLRELALYRAGVGAPTQDLARADRARTAISSRVARAVAEALELGQARRPLPDNHPANLPEVPLVVDLLVAVQADSVGDFAVLQDVLDEAERRAARNELLVRPGLPEVVALRDWACDQVIAQVAGTAARTWPGTDAERFAGRSPDGARELDWDPSAVRDSEVGIIAADDANRIVGISRPLADLLGWDADELVGRRIVAVVPHRYREAHVAGFTRHLTTGEAKALGVHLELPVLRRDGTEVACDFLIEATGTPTGRTVYVARITPL
jgi:PAS domain S-box-containing protein